MATTLGMAKPSSFRSTQSMPDHDSLIFERFPAESLKTPSLPGSLNLLVEERVEDDQQSAIQSIRASEIDDSLINDITALKNNIDEGKKIRETLEVQLASEKDRTKTLQLSLIHI